MNVERRSGILEHLGVCNCNDNAFLPKIAQTMGATYSQSHRHTVDKE
jgi:hypothetical protein